MPVRTRCVLIAALVLLAAAMSPQPSAAQAPRESWARLGPQGPGHIRAMAVAPSWPTDGLILALRAQGLLRSRDAGKTWERLALPFPIADGDLQFFGFAAT